jgi:enolase
MFIKEVKARKILDSRGEPSIEVSINGVVASAPSGKSKGKYETPSFHKSVEWNIDFLNNCEFNLEISSFEDLKKVELFLKKKTHLSDAKQFGADALVALEVAILKSLAKEQNKQLWQVINPKAKKFPIPVGNAVGGGLHSHNKEAPTFQEFLLIPKTSLPKENFKLLQNLHAKLKNLVNSTFQNDEGAWQTSLNEEQILEILSKFKQIRIGVDIAASSFYKENGYCYRQKELNKNAQIHFINALIKKFNLLYVEDPLQEEDFSGFAEVKRDKNHFVVGDDLTATHLSRLEKAIKLKSINAIIVKPNQNGSLLELQKVFAVCKKHNIKTIISHRSGETMDNALADLAFGFQADFIKCGIATKWREVKLKRLIEIEKTMRKA